MNTPPVSSINPINALLTVADPKQETAARLANIAIGQQVQGKVLAKLSDGSHIVDINNTAAKIVLPDHIKSGDTLFMTLVRNDPRPTFILNQSAGQNSNAATTQTNQQAGITTTLSDAAKLVETLAQNTASKPQTTSANALIPSAQQLQTPLLATALQNTIETSGLFYEAHVAQWVLGKRSKDDLLKEPQSKFSDTATDTLLNTKEAVDTTQGKLIQSQIASLEQQKVTWQGEVWPGQTMQWEIQQHQEQSSQQDNNADDNASSWQSTATFTFERLGHVSATLQLSGNQLLIHINTDKEASKNAMIAGQTALQDNLDNTGIKLKQLMVDFNEQKR